MAVKYIALIVIPLSVVLLFRRGFYKEILLGFFFILVLSDSYVSVLTFAKEVKEIYIVVLAGMFFFNINQFQPINRILLAFIPFFVVAIIALLNSDVAFIGFQKTFSYFFLFTTIPNYFIKTFREEGKEFLADLCWFGAFLLLVGLVLKFIAPDIAHIEGRFRGILGNPNGLGLFCMIFFLIFYLSNRYFDDLFSQKDKLIIYAFIFLSLILTESRGAIFAVLLFFMFHFLYGVQPFFGFLAFLIMTIGYQIFTDFLPVLIIEIGLQDYFRIDTLQEGSGRLIGWQFAWENIQMNPILGKGFAHTETLFHKFYQELSILGHQGNAHNSYLTFWLDTGLIGLLAYLIAFVGSFLRGAKNSKLAMPVMYAIMFSIYVESWLTASLNPYTIQFLIILTILTSPEINEPKEEDTFSLHGAG